MIKSCECCGRPLPSKFGGVAIVDGELEWFVDGERRSIYLTKTEAWTMEAILERGGKVTSKEQILNHIEWRLGGGFYDVEDKLVDVYICKVRRKLREGGAPVVIETMWGRGYMVASEEKEAA